MIVATTKVEKEERQKRSTVRTATLGYDTNKFLKTQVCIRDERSQQIQYEKLEIAPQRQGGTDSHSVRRCTVTFTGFMHRECGLLPTTPHKSAASRGLSCLPFSTQEGIVALLGPTSSARRKKPERKQEEARRKEGKEEGKKEMLLPSQAWRRKWRGSKRSAARSSLMRSSRSRHPGSEWSKGRS